jgi:hypothetical protein
VNIDLISKDTLTYEPKKMEKVASGKLLKLVVFARDVLQINQTEMRRQFDQYGTVVRFETVISDKYTASVDDSIDESFDEINYKVVFEAWVKDNKNIADEDRKEIIKAGNSIIAEVTNAERN